MTNKYDGMVVHKTLSANDLGLTGSHQAGILVPKELARTDFLPQLDREELNPREDVYVRLSTGREVVLKYIYYNNRRFQGTRDEYRLTYLTRPLKEIGATVGAVLQIRKLGDRFYSMGMLKEHLLPERNEMPGRTVLRLSGGWVLINM